MSVNVPGGTRSIEAPRLCDRCWSGVVLRGAADSEELVFCERLERPVTIRVIQCSRFEDRTEESLHELREIAWAIEPRAEGERFGFRARPVFHD